VAAAICGYEPKETREIMVTAVAAL